MDNHLSPTPAALTNSHEVKAEYMLGSLSSLDALLSILDALLTHIEVLLPGIETLLKGEQPFFTDIQLPLTGMELCLEL